MKIRTLKSEKGIALYAVIIFTVIFTILGFSILNLAGSEITLTQKEINKTKAFYLAEAGLARLSATWSGKGFENIDDTVLGEGSYRVEGYCEEYPHYAISTGRVGGKEKRIKVELSYLAPPYENGVYAGGMGSENPIFSLRGQGDPQPDPGDPDREFGGKDIVNGNIFVDGDVTLYEESSVNPAPLPNTYELMGDVNATGSVSILDSASISGEVIEEAEPEDAPDLVGMNYGITNTHNVSQIFAEAGINSGRLPSDHELYDVVVKNPSDRSDECASTVGDDYFIEPSRVRGGGDQKGAPDPLHLGSNRIYYIDGNVWVHHKRSYGFSVDGAATVVSTGDIRICDNIKYADSESLLGLVALGKYDGGGRIVSGGNVYFGDPRYGTMYTVSGLMFAADSFLFNTDAITGKPVEPTTGFTVFGNFSALNEVCVERDWYTDAETGGSRPAYFEPGEEDGRWVDLETGAALTSAEIDTLRHYQMKLDYDERVRNRETQPPALPRGVGRIFGGLTNWEELP